MKPEGRAMPPDAVHRRSKEQEKHDMAMDRLSVKEYEDPFK